jgi:hypothetical protein
VRRGEGVLEFRAKRREQLHIRPLSPSNRSDFTRRWTEVQSQFVDDPKGTVSRADSLVNEVMQVRGYPVGTSISERRTSRLIILSLSKIIAPRMISRFVMPAVRPARRICVPLSKRGGRSRCNLSELRAWPAG